MSDSLWPHLALRWARAAAAGAAILVISWSIRGATPMAWAASFEDPLPSGPTAKLKAEQVVRFSVASMERDARGAITTVKLLFQTRAGFKIYDKGLAFQLKPVLGESFKLTYTSDPAPAEAHDPWYDEVRATHSDGAVFALKGDVAMGAGDTIRLRFEACSVSMCLLPVWFDVPVAERAVSVPSSGSGDATAGAGFDLGSASGSAGSGAGLSGAAVTSPQPRDGAQRATEPTARPEPSAPVSSAPSIREQPPAPPQASKSVALADRLSLLVQEALTGRSVWLFPLLFLAGLAMNLTPCVYPMIPITLNVLGRLGRHGTEGGSHEAEHWSEGVIRASFYVLGIVVTYSGMGVVAGMTGTLFGSLLQSTVVVVGLAVLFVLFGLAMLGIIDFTRVQVWASRIPISERSPHFGVFTMGAVSGLVSAPCTGPVLSAILLLIGQSQDPLYGFSLMGFFALGFGAPYLVLGVFAHNLKRLPRAGRLLELVKIVFAALLFALALYYVRPLLSSVPFFGSLYANPGLQGFALCVALAVIFRLVSQQPQAASGRPGRHQMARLGFVLAMTQLALWMTLWLTNAFVVPPAVGGATAPGSSESGQSPTVAHMRWQSDWATAVAQARSEGKGLLVDAWAQWCAACLKMDATLWVDPAVIARINASFVPLKLDFTESSPFTDDIAKRWELTGLPGVALFPAGADFETMPPQLFRQQVERPELFEAMDRLADAHPAQPPR